MEILDEPGQPNHQKRRDFTQDENLRRIALGAIVILSVMFVAGACGSAVPLLSVVTKGDALR
jgi:hypothetical protein